jgi:hypothetical protein
MQKKRGVYRKTDVGAYINEFVEKYMKLRKPITRKDEKIYNYLLNRYYKLVMDIVYILNKEIPKKKRAVVKRKSSVKEDKQ